MCMVGRLARRNAAAFSLDHNLLNLWIGRSALMRQVETVQSARGLIPAENLYMGANHGFG
jgi:hypothetical protein